MFSKLPCIISLPRHYVGIMYAISMIYIYYIYKKISKKSYIIEVYTISTRFLLKNYVYHPSYPDHLSTVSNISIYTYLCLSISIYINLYLPISIYIYLQGESKKSGISKSMYIALRAIKIKQIKF